MRRVNDSTQTQDQFEALFEEALKASPVTVAGQDLDLRYLWIQNPLAQFGMSPADFIGRTDEDLAGDSGESEAGILAISEMKVRVRDSGIGERALVPIRTPEGSQMYLDTTVEPIRDAGGQLTGITSMCVDVTAYREKEMLLRWQRDELDSLNEELEAFAYSVSHDLRAPLRSIDGFSQALVEDYGDDLDDEALDYLLRIRRGATRMSTQIDDLLRLSRITRSELKPERLDLGELARSEFGRLVPEDRSIDVAVDTEMLVIADRQLLRVALENLIANAIKFTRDEDDARIRIGVEPDSRPRIYYVEDNGVGFEMEYSDRLFGAFQRLHAQSDFEGHGIGLATAKRVVSRHGGKIWAESAVDSGAKFSFTLEGGGGGG